MQKDIDGSNNIVLLFCCDNYYTNKSRKLISALIINESNLYNLEEL